MGSVFGEWMLKIKFRVHVNARNCHEPHFHETAKLLLYRRLPDPCQPDRIGATGKSGGKSADRLFGGLS